MEQAAAVSRTEHLIYEVREHVVSQADILSIMYPMWLFGVVPPLLEQLGDADGAAQEAAACALRQLSGVPRHGRNWPAWPRVERCSSAIASSPLVPTALVPRSCTTVSEMRASTFGSSSIRP